MTHIREAAVVVDSVYRVVISEESIVDLINRTKAQGESSLLEALRRESEASRDSITYRAAIHWLNVSKEYRDAVQELMPMLETEPVCKCGELVRTHHMESGHSAVEDVHPAIDKLRDLLRRSSAEPTYVEDLKETIRMLLATEGDEFNQVKADAVRLLER